MILNFSSTPADWHGVFINVLFLWLTNNETQTLVVANGR